MTSAMPRALLGLVLLLTAGCTTSALPAWFPVTWPSGDERTARRPSGEAREGEAKTARGAPDRSGDERLVIPPKRSTASDCSRLIRRAVSATTGPRERHSPGCCSEYPRSRWDAEARAWQATLTDLLVREDEARRALLRLQRSEGESKRTKANLEWLRQIEIEQERRK